MRKQAVLILILSLSLFALFSSVRTNSDPINARISIEIKQRRIFYRAN